MKVKFYCLFLIASLKDFFFLLSSMRKKKLCMGHLLDLCFKEFSKEGQ